MDFGDIGTEATEVATADAISRVRANAGKKLEPTGTCRNPKCEDDTDQVFCSLACRDEYEYIQKRKQ